MSDPQPPFPYLRLAPLDRNGEPILKAGEGASQWPRPNGPWYITAEGIELQGV